MPIGLLRGNNFCPRLISPRSCMGYINANHQGLKFYRCFRFRFYKIPGTTPKANPLSWVTARARYPGALGIRVGSVGYPPCANKDMKNSLITWKYLLTWCLDEGITIITWKQTCETVHPWNWKTSTHAPHSPICWLLKPPLNNIQYIPRKK